MRSASSGRTDHLGLVRHERLRLRLRLRQITARPATARSPERAARTRRSGWVKPEHRERLSSGPAEHCVPPRPEGAAPAKHERAAHLHLDASTQSPGHWVLGTGHWDQELRNPEAQSRNPGSPTPAPEAPKPDPEPRALSPRTPVDRLKLTPPRAASAAASPAPRSARPNPRPESAQDPQPGDPQRR